MADAGNGSWEKDSQAFSLPDEADAVTAAHAREIRQRVTAFTADLQSKDVGRLTAWFDDASHVWVPAAAPVSGARLILLLFRMTFRKYIELHWEVENIYCVGPNAAVVASASWGIRVGDVPYRNSILTLVHFTDAGKISSLSDYMKDTQIFS